MYCHRTSRHKSEKSETQDPDGYWSAATDRAGFQALCIVARLNILHDAFVALKAISDFWVKCRGRGRILGFMIDSLATLNMSEVGKYKTF